MKKAGSNGGIPVNRDADIFLFNGFWILLWTIIREM